MKIIKKYNYLFLLSFCILSGCKLNPNISDEVKLMIDWNREVFETEILTEGIAVPISARFYSFYGMLPLIVDSYNHNNFNFINNNFPKLILPENKAQNINLKLALNIAYYEFLSKFYVNLHFKNKVKIDNLYKKWDDKFVKNVREHEIENSKRLGLKIARELLNYANNDSIASLAQLHNFDRTYVPPVGEGLWEINDEHPMPALLPNWGQVKPVLLKIDTFKSLAPPPFSNEKNSEYYIDALELFTISSPLSFENKWIAEFWSDDVRGLTFTPAARWISILCLILEQEESSFETAKEAFFKLGIGLGDGGILCWKTKYTYNLNRPETYIRKNIHDAWRPFHESPNFPSYPSGHSVFGGVSAEILSDIFGEKINFTDTSHEGRKEFLNKPRTYTSFKEIAIENAYSRIPLGVHFRMDCTEGLRLGYELGKTINSIDIKSNKEVSFKN